MSEAQKPNQDHRLTPFFFHGGVYKSTEQGVACSGPEVQE